MDAKKELLDKLCGLVPEKTAEIETILAGYNIARGPQRERSDLKKRICAFLAAKKIDGLSPKTLKNYREMLMAFAAQVDKHITKIATDDIRAYIGHLAERGLKDSSIQTHINTLRSFFSWLDVEDLIRKNPMRKIKSLKIDRAKARRPLTAEQLERLRDGCRTYKEKALVEFLVSTGCRLSELVGVRVGAVDWQGRSVVVLGKGGKERTVYFSVRAKLMLQEYLGRRRGGEALFASSRAPYEAMRPRAVEKALQKIGERAGEPMRIHPHLMRHTFASNALNSGMDITIIQHLLGHTDPKTTLIYAELAPRTVKYEYERVVA